MKGILLLGDKRCAGEFGLRAHIFTLDVEGIDCADEGSEGRLTRLQAFLEVVDPIPRESQRVVDRRLGNGLKPRIDPADRLTRRRRHECRRPWYPPRKRWDLEWDLGDFSLEQDHGHERWRQQ